MAVKSIDLLIRAREQVDKAVGKSRRAIQGFNRELGVTRRIAETAKKAVSLFGAAIVAASAAISFALVKRMIAATDAIGKTADMIGITVEALQELYFAASQSGIGQQLLESSLARLGKRLGEARQGSKTLDKGLSILGLTLKDLTGIPLDEAFKRIADIIPNVTRQTDKLAAATTFFGREGLALINILRLGSKGIEELQQKARDLGLVLSDEMVRNAEAANDQLDIMQRVLSVQLTSVVVSLAPKITAIGHSFTNIVKSLRGVEGVKLTETEQSIANLATDAGNLARDLGKIVSWLVKIAGTLKDIGGFKSGIRAVIPADPALRRLPSGAFGLAPSLSVPFPEISKDAKFKQFLLVEKRKTVPPRDGGGLLGLPAPADLDKAKKANKAILDEEAKMIDQSIKEWNKAQKEKKDLERDWLDFRITEGKAFLEDRLDLIKAEMDALHTARENYLIGEIEFRRLLLKLRKDESRTLKEIARRDKESIEEIAEETKRSWDDLLSSMLSGVNSFGDLLKNVFLTLKDLLGGGEPGSLRSILSGLLKTGGIGAGIGNVIARLTGGGGIGATIGGGLGGILGKMGGQALSGFVDAKLGSFLGPIGSVVGSIGGSLLGGLFGGKKGKDPVRAAIKQWVAGTLWPALAELQAEGFGVGPFGEENFPGFNIKGRPGGTVNFKRAGFSQGIPQEWLSRMQGLAQIMPVIEQIQGLGFGAGPFGQFPIKADVFGKAFELKEDTIQAWLTKVENLAGSMKDILGGALSQAFDAASKAEGVVSFFANIRSGLSAFVKQGIIEGILQGSVFTKTMAPFFEKSDVITQALGAGKMPADVAENQLTALFERSLPGIERLQMVFKAAFGAFKNFDSLVRVSQEQIETTQVEVTQSLKNMFSAIQKIQRQGFGAGPLGDFPTKENFFSEAFKISEDTIRAWLTKVENLAGSMKDILGGALSEAFGAASRESGVFRFFRDIRSGLSDFVRQGIMEGILKGSAFTKAMAPFMEDAGRIARRLGKGKISGATAEGQFTALFERNLPNLQNLQSFFETIFDTFKNVDKLIKGTTGTTLLQGLSPDVLRGLGNTFYITVNADSSTNGEDIGTEIAFGIERELSRATI